MLGSLCSGGGLEYLYYLGVMSLNSSLLSLHYFNRAFLLFREDASNLSISLTIESRAIMHLHIAFALCPSVNLHKMESMCDSIDVCFLLFKFVCSETNRTFEND